MARPKRLYLTFLDQPLTPRLRTVWTVLTTMLFVYSEVSKIKIYRNQQFYIYYTRNKLTYKNILQNKVYLKTIMISWYFAGKRYTILISFV